MSIANKISNHVLSYIKEDSRQEIIPLDLYSDISEENFAGDLALTVPDDRDLRRRIYSLAASYVKKKKYHPPVNPGILRAMAEDFSLTNEIDASYKAFCMLALGNEIWRPVVSSVPFDRRILLLPECLKNSSKCRACHDSIGLVCEGCNSCELSGIVEKAENLGYHTIIAEGTTAARKLVEGGSIDAIIGVGCLDVLQKLYSMVNSNALPGIGIPLLRDGCVDTAVDAEWLLREISFIKPSNERRSLYLGMLKKETNELFTKQNANLIAGECLSPTQKTARDYLLLDGKRVRPLLMILVYEAIAEKHDKPSRDMLAFSLECFHKASLIHDDIEDDDKTRYGVSTLHCRYGVPLAINTGDFLIGEGYRLISLSSLDPAVKTECFSIAARGHVDVTDGQGDELFSIYENSKLNVDQVMGIFMRKTSAAFRISLQMGAAAAGAGKKLMEHLARLSDAFGIAFQIRDDIQDYNGREGDILSKRISLLSALSFQLLDSGGREKFNNALNSKDAAALTDLLKNTGALELSRRILRKNLSVVYSELDAIGNRDLTLVIHQICAGLFRDYI